MPLSPVKSGLPEKAKPRQFGQVGTGNKMGGGAKKGSPLAGCPPKIVRYASRMGYYDRIPFLKKVADGEAYVIQTVVTPMGRKVKIKQYASIGERIRAMEVMAKFGGLTSLTLEQEEPSSGPTTHDLSTLETADLLRLEQILSRASLVATTADGTEVHEHTDAG